MTIVLSSKETVKPHDRHMYISHCVSVHKDSEYDQEIQEICFSKQCRP